MFIKLNKLKKFLIKHNRKKLITAKEIFIYKKQKKGAH